MDDIKHLSRAISRRLASHEKVPDFLSLVRHLQNIAPVDAPRIGRASSVGAEVVEFSQTPHLKFAESQIANIAPKGDGVILSQYFFGLTGPNAPLPLEMTNLVLRKKQSDYDDSLARFLDIINHRFASLYFCAFAREDIAAAHDFAAASGDLGADIFAQIIGGFAGGMGVNSKKILNLKTTQNAAAEVLNSKTAAPHDSVLNSKPILNSKTDLNLKTAQNLKPNAAQNQPHGSTLPAATPLAFANVLRHKTRNTSGLAQMLGRFFGVPFVVRDFVPTVGDIPPQHLTRLGQNARLGQNTQLGSHYRTNTAKIALEVGPISLAQAANLLPGGRGFTRIIELINLYTTRPIMHQIDFKFKKDSAIATQLNGSRALGVGVWLASPNCQTKELNVSINSYNWAKKINQKG